MNSLDKLNIPSNASIILENVSISWKDIISSLTSLPFDHSTRNVIGVQGDNSIETIKIILSIIQNRCIPAPFSPNINVETRNICLSRLGARALWSSSNKWEILSGDTVTYPYDFDIIMHSSGTTSIPKPIAIRFESMYQNALDIKQFLNLSKETHLGTMSYCYMSGLFNATLLPLILGCDTICQPIINILNIKTFIQSIEKHNPGVVWINPLLAKILVQLNGINSNLFKNTPFIISCTSPLSIKIKQKFHDKFNRELLQSYGLSETLINTIETPNQNCFGSVGKPIGDKTHFNIIDNEIVISGPTVCSGYIYPLPSTIKPLSHFKTGDLAEYDDKGNVFITGRNSSMINVNGIKFPAEKLETKLLELTQVDDVAVGQVDDVLVAIVDSKSSSTELFKTFTNNLEIYERPNIIKVVSNIPRNASYKLDRQKIKIIIRNIIDEHTNSKL